MRIALVTETFYPAVDGTTTTLKAVADRLIDTGHEVRVIAPGPGLATYRRSAVVRVNPLVRPGSQVREALAAWSPDVVHVVSPGTRPRSIGRKALKHARRLGLRTLVLQQSPVSELTWELWRTTIAERADRLVVTAPWLADQMSALGVPARVWTPGVDTAAFSPALRDAWLHRSWSRAGAAAGPLTVVGYVGSLHRRHGVRRLPQLREVPGVRPVIVGDGPQRDWLATRMPDARFTGTLSAGDLATALASLDVLVHPGEHETCCHALREAAASGVPVVAPRSGGAAAVVRSLETGVLYDPLDPRGLARAVASVAADSRRAALGRRGRELAGERDWKDAVDELVARHYAATRSSDAA